MSATSRLDARRQLLLEEIQQREFELAVLRAELKQLDDALDALRDGNIPLTQEQLRSARRSTSSLADEIIQVVENSELGLSAKEIAEQLQGKHREHFASHQSYLATIHTTTRRLALRGKLSMMRSEKGLIFMPLLRAELTPPPEQEHKD